MKKVIFFDIDGTLFDVSFFIKLFHKELVERFGLNDKDISEIKTIYDEIKKEEGYFLPSAFISKISNRFKSIDKNELEQIFQNVDLFKKSVYKDTPVITSLANLALIGIFSQGDESFQRKKITFIKNVLDDDNVFVFPNKLTHAKEIFDEFAGFEIFLIDDNLELLKEIKKIVPSITEILIDRKGKYKDNNDISKIYNLNELKPLIYD